MIDDEKRAKRDEAIAKRRNWKPTPSQEESDLLAMGVPADEIPKRGDGSGPDPHVDRARAMWPKRNPAGGYETR
jgi:hypothetical protein